MRPGQPNRHGPPHPTDLSEPNHVKLDVIMRVVGSILVVVSYIALVHIDTVLGVRLQLLGDGLAIPFFVRVKAWDVVTMIGVLSFVSVSKLA